MGLELIPTVLGRDSEINERGFVGLDTEVGDKGSLTPGSRKVVDLGAVGTGVTKGGELNLESVRIDSIASLLLERAEIGDTLVGGTGGVEAGVGGRRGVPGARGLGEVRGWCRGRGAVDRGRPVAKWLARSFSGG